MPGADGGVEADLAELQSLSASCQRPRVKAMLDAYVAQLQALREEAAGPPTKGEDAVAMVVESPAPAPAAPAPLPAESKPKAVPAAPAPAAQATPPVRLATPAVGSSADVKYVSIASYGWDQDSFGKEPNNVYIYLMSGFEGVGECKERVSCAFGAKSVDLKILDFKGKNYRLVLDLNKEIIPDTSKVSVKKNRITITLSKTKGQFGYDSWTDLKQTRQSAALDKDPGAGLMDMMKQMYDDGDDQMKKTLGEAMLKSRQQQMNGKPSFDDDV